MAAVAAALALGAACAATTAEPRSPTAASVESEAFARLVKRYVDAAGNVDYAAWKASPHDVAELHRYVEHLLAQPPAATIDPAEQLGYWIDLYNGLVLREILDRWPIASVVDVAGTDGTTGISARGLFYDLTFDVGESRMSLLDIETEIIRRNFDDPRAHFALYCGTRSCPLLPGTPFSEGSLERRLDQATRAFVNHGGRVVVDPTTGRIAISPVFGWYEQDFIDFVKRRADIEAPTIVDFLVMHADPRLAKELEAARGRQPIEFVAFDWRLNEIGAPDDPIVAPDVRAGATEEEMPELIFATLEGGRWSPSQARGKVLLIDFWATWCRPCLLSFPHYARLQLEYERQGFEVVAVAEDTSPAPVKAFAAANRMAISIVLDPDNQASDAPLSIATLPTVLLVDRDGVVRYRHEGYSEPDVDRLEQQIVELLGKPAPAAPR
jgi:thiol-disulfide isomerase/thioredoxin